MFYETVFHQLHMKTITETWITPALTVAHVNLPQPDHSFHEESISKTMAVWHGVFFLYIY